jgi:hypothetical protein
MVVFYVNICNIYMMQENCIANRRNPYLKAGFVIGENAEAEATKDAIQNAVFMTSQIMFEIIL